VVESGDCWFKNVLKEVLISPLYHPLKIKPCQGLRAKKEEKEEIKKPETRVVGERKNGREECKRNEV
jgi:hypothetical protein